MAMVKKKTVEDVPVAGKRVLVRVDFNVPLDKKTGAITDDKRIRGALPTIQYLLAQGARVILVSHLGRPQGGPDPSLSMKPVADRLAALLERPVTLAADVIGEDAKAKAAALRDGDVLMLENVRFHPEESKNDPAFARELAALAELYVNDAFGTAHRAHASTAGLANHLPAVCGYLIQKELDVMGVALRAPKRPFVAILGGAKVSDKIHVIENLLTKVDTLIIGGGMAYTFYKALGYAIGDSLCEEDRVELAASLLQKAKDHHIRLLLPIDNIVADRFAPDAARKAVDTTEIPDGWQGLDIGDRTVTLFSTAIQDAGTVVWNGPVGVFEFDAFANGTREVARAVATSQAISIIGGGDSAAAVEQMGFADQVTHISTGGGAALEFLEGRVLPGIACLQDADDRRTMAAGNWKMNHGTPAAALQLLTALKPQVADVASEVVVGVPFTALPAVVDACAYTNLAVAAQNCHFEDHGAYTGEISAQMLARMGVKYVILGHSERRAYFGESDDIVNQKIKAALHWGVRPIFCCGESLEQREGGQTFSHIRRQVVFGLQGVSADRMGHVTIAYEPIWAIGTGQVATEGQAQEVCLFIRNIVRDMFGDEIADRQRILYGGSVNAQNAAGLFAMDDIDGGLVGGASLKADDFAVICQA